MIDDRTKVGVYEQLLHSIHMCRAVAMNSERTVELLDRISDWSYAHRMGNGELPEEEQAQIIEERFWKLKG